jgi:hypothetical protein
MLHVTSPMLGVRFGGLELTKMRMLAECHLCTELSDHQYSTIKAHSDSYLENIAE